MSGKFDQLYKELVAQLRGAFPSMSKKMTVDERDGMYLVQFVECNLPFIDDIAIRNRDAFLLKHKGAELVKGMLFRKVIEKSPAELVDAVFDYLRDLYLAATETEADRVKLEKAARKINDKYIENRMNALIGHDAIMRNFMNVEPEVGSDEAYSAGDGDSNNGEGDGEAPFNPEEFMNSFADTEIGRLAKEMSENLGAEDTETINKIATEGMQNPMDLFSRLLSGVTQAAGPATGETEETPGSAAAAAAAEPQQPVDPLAGLVGRTVQNLQAKIQSGQIDMAKMMKDAQKLVQKMGAGGAGGAAGNPMASMMAAAMGGAGGAGGGMPDIAQMMAAMTGGGGARPKKGRGGRGGKRK